MQSNSQEFEQKEQSFAAIFLKKLISFFVILSFTSSQIFLPCSVAYSANITDVAGLTPDGSTNTVTDRAPNNTPIVNIAAPSAAGVSLNNFSDYNVSRENQILNNYKGATTNTNLAGQIYGNPNFNPSGVSEATTIVNQVTGNNRTNLAGATEVAGRKANVIIANGNGIDVAGASYINTSSLSLVSGLVNINSSGVVESFTLSNIANSNIIITGVDTPTYANLGLDVSSVDYVDIITRSAQVLGDIHAKAELNFKLGNGTFDYANKTISSNSSLGSATKPDFALDSSHLGGMYAGKITLIATENGIGVKSRGDLVSRVSDINFNVAGDIEYERINSETNISLTSTSGKITAGKYATISRPAITYAKGNITLTGEGGIELNDSSQDSNFYAAGSIFLNSTNNLVKNNSTIKAENNIFVNAASFENTSLVFSVKDLSIIVSGLAKNTSGTIESSQNIEINSGSFNNAALIQAGANAILTSSSNFIDTNKIKASGNLTISANSGISYNDLYSGGNLSLTNSTSGDITQSSKSYSVGKSDITNNGGNIIFGGSLVFSGDALKIISSGILTNNTDIISDQSITLENSGLVNNQKIIANTNLTITSTGGLVETKNLLQSKTGDIVVTADVFNNSALVQAFRDITLTLSGSFTDSNQIKANRDLTINSQTGITYNDLYSGRNLNITNHASGDISQTAKSYSVAQTNIRNNGGNITIAGSSLFSGDALTIFATGLLTNNSDLLSDQSITLTAANFTNNQKVISKSNLLINANSGLVKSNTLQSSLGSVTINTERFENSVLVKAKTDIILTLTGSFLDTGKIEADLDLNIDARTGITYNDLHAGQNLKLINRTSGDIIQNKKSYSVGKTDITNLAGDINFSGESLFSGDDLDIAASGSITNNIDLISSKNFNLSATNLTNNQAMVAGVDLLSVISSNLTNNGLIFAGQNIDLQVDGIFTNNKGAEIFALNGNVQISGKARNANYPNSAQYSFLLPSFNKKSAIWDDLKLKGYIDDNGKITDSFKSLIFKEDDENFIDPNFVISDSLSVYRAAIYKALEQLSPRITSADLAGKIQKDFDSQASVIRQILIDKNYIDSSGKILPKFYNDTKLGASGLSLENTDFSCCKEQIYNLIQDARNGRIIQNNFLGINSGNLDLAGANLVSELKAKGYLDANGKITDSFKAITNPDALDLSAAFSSSKTDIFTKIRESQIVSNSTFDFLTTVGLISELKNKGYIDENGNITTAFDSLGTNFSALDVGSAFAAYKEEIFNKIKNTESINKVQQSNFDALTYNPSDSIKTSAELYAQLQADGYIDEKGNIQEKYYTDGLTASTVLSGLSTQQQNKISEALNSITQASLGDSNFRKITASLDNSAARLIEELKQAGYLDENGKKTTAFPVSLNNMTLSSAEFDSVKSAVYNAINNQDANHVFVSEDFLGSGFDASVLFDESKILFDELKAQGYLSINGNPKDSFYNLSGNYSGINLDARFSNLKNEIGQVVSSVNQAQISLTNLAAAGASNINAQSTAVFNELVTKGYLTSNGDFTDKMNSQVINFSVDRITNYTNLAADLDDSLKIYAAEIYDQIIKANNGSTQIRNYSQRLDNLNGAKIKSGFGDINIKAITFNNLARDNVDVTTNKEAAVQRTKYRKIASPWRNTVLWGYDVVVSTLESAEDDISIVAAGRDLKIEANAIDNRSSKITAGHDININTSSLSNRRTEFVVKVPQIYKTHWKSCNGWGSCDSGTYFNTYESDFLLRSNTAAIISSGRNLNITAITKVGNDEPTEKNASLSTPTQDSNNPQTPNGEAGGMVNVGTPQKGSVEIINPAKPAVDQWQISVPTSNNGLFKKAPPTSEYLIETRYNTNDPNTLTGSRYYTSRFGFNPNQNNVKWLGDPFYEWNIINEQILSLTKKQQDWNQWDQNNGLNNNSSWQVSLNQLIDNAYAAQTSLYLTPGVKLTQNQINALKKDIIWYEEEDVKLADGSTQRVLTPRVYLAKNGISNLDLNKNNPAESAILASNVNITAGSDVVNYGKIIATKSQTQLAGASGNLSIISGSDIINKSTLKSDNQLNLIAAKNITNSSSINSLTIKHVGGTDIFGNIAKTAKIEGGSVNINAGNDFNNIAANIITNKNDLGKNSLGNNTTSSGNLSITAGDDINITTLELKNQIEKTWGNSKKGGHSIDETVVNVGSEISSAGNLTLSTTGLGTNNEKTTVDAKFATAQTQYNADLATYNQAVTDYPNKLTAYNNALAAYNAAKSAGGFRAALAKEPTPPTIPTAPTAPVYSKIMASVDNGGSDITIVGSNVSTTTNGANININANDSVNIVSAVDSAYKMESSHKKGLIVQKSSLSINSSTTNVASNINSLGDVNITSGLDTNIIASKLSGTGSGSIISGGDTSIFNSVDTSYSYSESTKTRTGLIRQIPIVGQMISALSTVMSVDLSTVNGLTGGNLKGIQRGLGIDYNKSNLANGSNTEKLVASNLNFGNNLTVGSNADLTVKASNLTTTAGDITLAANNNVNILSVAETSTTNRNYRDKSDRAKERGNTDTTGITSISSIVTSGSDLTIVSGNDTTIQSSKLSSGDNLTVTAGNNLLLLTAKDAAIKNDESKGGTAYTFTNGTSGYMDVKAVNNEITSNTNSATINSNLDLNATNSILVQYRAGTMEDVLSSANSSNQQLAYLKTIDDLKQADPNKVMLDPIADTMKQWDQTTRGLTGAGTAVVAIAAIAITVVTMGSGATLGAAMMTAVAASGAATASVAATNASMNTDSSLLGSTKSISSNTWKATTSKESLQNMAIAAITAGAAYGASVYLSTASSTAGAGSSAGSAAGSGSGAASGTGAAANTSTSLYVSPNFSNTTVLTTSSTNTSSFLTNLGNAARNVGIATTSNIAATSLVKGQSISQVIAEQGGLGKVLTNSALQALAQAGAQAIGGAAHGTPIRNSDGSLARNLDGSIAYTTPTITQGQQIALHAALGCGIGAGMSGGASGCASGAAAGVIGELTSGAMYQEGRTNPDGTPIGFSRNTSIAMGGLSGSLASAFTSIALGDDDSKIAKNIYAGNFVGTNAAANNAVLVAGKYKIPGSELIKTPDGKDYDLHFGVQGTLTRTSASFGTDGFGLGVDLNPSLGVGFYGNILPHGENASYSVITGFKNSSYGSGGLIITNQGNYGATGSWGVSMPFYPIPTNMSVSIPLENLKQK